MIKRTFKFFVKFLIGIIVLMILVYFSFLGWEYITGGKYVDYLKANSETVLLSESFTYDLAVSDIKNSKLILVGESHGFNEPAKFDFHFFKYLHKDFGVRTYVAEFDFAQATLLNEFLRTGDEELLHKIRKKWVVAQGRNNKDYFDKYMNFHRFYQQLPDDEKFQFIGIDKIQDWDLTIMLINQLSGIDSTLNPIVLEKKSIRSQLKDRIEKLISINVDNQNNIFVLRQLLKNISYVENKTNRENVMFSNFRDIYIKYDLDNEKVYGFFGLYHVFQYRINGEHPLASQIRKSDLGLENSVVSMNFLFVDSYMVMNSSMLPEFMRDEGKYTRMPVSSDNVLVIYIYGIKDFKRMTEANHKSFIKMNGEHNPYAESGRLNTTIQLLPVTDIFEMTDKGKPYIQYTIFVRNSDWAEPIEE